jgi:hypothetical protein
MSQKNLLFSIRVFLTILNEIHNILKKIEKNIILNIEQTKKLQEDYLLIKKILI